MKPPSFLHLIDELRIGGAQTHLVTILREAVGQYSFDHRVVSLFGDGLAAEQLREIGVPVDVLDLRDYLANGRFLGAAGVLEKLCREHRPDVVEAHLTWSRLLGLYAAWRAKVPLRIGFEHGDMYLNSWKFRAANFVGQHFAHRIVVCSQSLADWAHRTHGFSRARMTVLHNCVDLRQFRPGSNESLRGAWGFGGPATVFAAVGTLGRGVNKRVDICIRAIAAARSAGADVALVICGDGAQRAELEQLARDTGTSPFVRFLGMRSDVAEVLTACDAFCHAAPFEPFGIVCIEAMAAGLPVVIPNAGGIVEAVEHGVTGIVYSSLNVQELAQAMRRLHFDEQGRTAMGRRARREVENRFSVERYVDELYGLYGVKRKLVTAVPA